MRRTAASSFSFQKLGILVPAVIATLLWGSAFPAIKIGYTLVLTDPSDLFGKLLFAGIRFTAAGVLVLAAAKVTGVRHLRPERSQLPGLVLLALVQTFLQYALYYTGLGNTTGVRGSVLMGSSSLFSVLLAHFLCRGERLTPRKLAGCAVGLAGIVIMAGDSLSGTFTLSGDGLIVLSALCNGVAFCISANVSKGRNPLQITGFQLTLGGALLILVSLPGRPKLVLTLPGMLLLLYLSLLSAAAFGLWTALLKYHPVGKVALYNFLVPIFGTGLSGLLLRERFLSVPFVLSLVLVCLSIAVVNCAGPGAKKPEQEGKSP